MMNPDGSEKFIRENALNIDLNRDAIKLQSPEAKILKNLFKKLKPEFGFNLHDQDSRYSVGKSNKQASISFLCPPYNYEKDINDVRTKTMQVIAEINDSIKEFIPNGIGKYSDDFEPRAFGDNFIKWGMSSILIESGGLKDDPNKEFLRKLNFVSILVGLYSMATNSYKSRKVDEYFTIPDNEKFLYDLILRNVEVQTNDSNYKIDIAINRYENKSNDKFIYHSKIEEVGDLSIYYGIEEHDFENYELLSQLDLLRIETTANLELLDKTGKKIIIDNGFIKKD